MLKTSRAREWRTASRTGAEIGVDEVSGVLEIKKNRMRLVSMACKAQG